MVDDSSRLLVLGTSLATYSAFRLIKHAVEQNKPVLMISLGPSRADTLPGVEKIEMPSGVVLEEVLDRMLGNGQGSIEKEVRELMRKGVVNGPRTTKQPRAEG